MNKDFTSLLSGKIYFLSSDIKPLSSISHHFPSIHPMALQPKSGLGLLYIEVSLSHRIRHTVGLLWTSDQPVAEACTCTGQHNIQTNIQAPSGIRKHDSSNQAAEDLRLRPRPLGSAAITLRL
jgi:hypothetical protein